MTRAKGNMRIFRQTGSFSKVLVVCGAEVRVLAACGASCKTSGNLGAKI
jgi:hypothetical protein